MIPRRRARFSKLHASFIGGIAIIIGVAMVWRIFAAGTPLAFEAETGALANCAAAETNAGASGSSVVRFGGPGCQQTYGASLPITYSLASLSGTKRFVSPSGSDTTGAGTEASPYATVTKAYGVAVSGDSLVVRGGTYRQGPLTISTSKPVKIIAYPGEIPVFNGAQSVTSGWVAEGALQYHAYTPMPVTDGSGISFTTGENLTGDGVGKYPDQAWVGNTQLRQVTTKAAVVDGKFFVDSANGRLYLTAANAALGNIEYSQNRTLFNISAPGTVIEGVKITRYSNSANDYGVIKFLDTADNGVMRNVEMSEISFITVLFGTGSINSGSLLKNVTLTTSNWMGVDANTTDNMVLDNVKITNMNQFGEFTNSPQSGAFKTSRTRGTKVLNSYIANNNSQGLWFDQSNVDTDVANSQIIDNAGSGIFFEISDDLLLINNYIHATGTSLPVKLAGSSGLKLINNTIIGGGSPVGIYTDDRSIPGCSNPANALCAGSYSSDRDTVRPIPDTLDWIPRLDIMQNNIIGYTTGSGYCGVTLVCVTQTNASASVALGTIIHHADSLRPQTIINGNVYANGTGKLISLNVNYSTLASFISAMTGAPVSISGFESAGKEGNSWVAADGTPTAALTAAHAQALPIPTNANINEYIPAGTKHYGVLNR